MSVTSANIEDLQTFIGGSRTTRTARVPDHTSCRTKANAVIAACPEGDGYYVPTNAPSMGAVANLLDTWRQNEVFVREIRQDLIEANQFDENGNATVPDSVIAVSLAEAGVANPPAAYAIPETELVGSPPHSGFVDDPICLANGNLLMPEEDLDLPGLAAVLSVVRTYNSRNHSRSGVFGSGWSSLADVALAVGDRTAEFVGPDGGAANFAAHEDGSWAPNLRRKLSLEATPAGWQVRHRGELAWRFDADGTFVGFDQGASRVTVERTSTTIVLREETSGRHVTYTRDETSGLVVSATASDGRATSYTYDDAGHLIGVERPRGGVTYDVDDNGFVAAVIDADGILVCRNVYDHAGRVLSQTENHGRETYYEYRDNGVATVTASDGAPPNVMVHDRRGRMTAMIDGLGNTMRLSYDDRDNLVHVVERTGAERSFEYDDRDNLVRQIHPDGLSESYRWDEADRLVGLTNRAGDLTTYEYQGEQRSPHRTVLPDGSHIEVELDTRELPLTIRDADGVAVTFEWTADATLAAVVDGLGNRTEVTYDAAGRSIATTSPLGVSVALALDHAGRVRRAESPEGVLTYEYSAAGRAIGGSLMNGNNWRASLDSAGDIERIEDDAGVRTSLERSSTGKVTASVGADGSRRSFEYDPVGRAVATVDPEGNRVEAEYDPEGRLTQLVDPSGRLQSRELDALGRVVMSVQPGGGTTTITYHPGGGIASYTDPEGGEWAYEVDAMGRVVAATDPLGGVTTYRYTPGGRLSEVVSPTGRSLRRRYDEAGRLSVIVEPDGTEVHYERRADGQVARMVRDGVETTIDYDDVGRRSAVAGPWGSVAAEQPLGQPTSLARGQTQAATFEYDPRGQLARFVDPAGVATTYTNDERGQVVAHTTGDISSSYGYSPAGWLTSVTDPYGNVTHLSRDPRGALTAITRPDGSGATFEMGLDGLVSAVLDSTGVRLVEVERDLKGSITTATAGAISSRVDRDALGRVTEVRSDAGAVTYRWDADGYLTGMADDSGFEVTIESDDGVNPSAVHLRDGTRIPVPEQPEREIDDAGRTTVDEQGRRYRYDLAGRLSETVVDGASTTYEYNDLGLLATEHTPVGVRTYHYGRAGELLELTGDDGSGITLEYDTAGRRTAERHHDGAVVTYQWDDRDRMIAISRTAADGTQTGHRIRYDAFGRPAFVDDTPILWDLGATGRLLGVGDERYLWSGGHVRVAAADTEWSRRVSDDPWGVDGDSGLRLGYRGELALDDLLMLQDRVYDTRTRSFLSRDPKPSRPGEVSFAGVYAYAWNDPVNFVDPTGQEPLSDAEFATFIEESKKGFLDKVDWKKVGVAVLSATAMVVATALAPGVGTAIMAGILIGATTGAANSMLDGNSLLSMETLKQATIGGILGGLTGGLGKVIPASTATSFWGRLASNTGRTAPVEMGSAYANEGLQSYTFNGDGSFDFRQATVEGLVSTGVGVTGAEIQYRPGPGGSGAIDDLVTNPIEIPQPGTRSPLVVVENPIQLPSPPPGMSQHPSGLYLDDPPAGFHELPSGLLVPN